MVLPTLAGVAAPDAKELPQKRNVVFILTDDMRLDMTAYGGGKLQTPNLDMLKSEAVNFKNACTTTGLSTPSRAALFTGRLGHRTGLEDNLNLWHCEDLTLDKDCSTIYEWASAAGYNVAYFGKWHLGYISPADRGAEQFVGSPSELVVKKQPRPSYSAIDKYYDKSYQRDVAKGKQEKPHYYATQDCTYEQTEAKKQVDLGVKFLEELPSSDNRPFFLTLSFHSPHPSYKVPAPYNKMYDYRDITLPESLHNNHKGLEFQHDVLWPWMDVDHMSDDDWRKTISYSMGLCTMFDQALGEFFDELKAQGLWEDTLIVFTSDQGTMLAEHGLYDKGPYAYEGLMKIPMLVKMPKGEAAEVEHQVSLIDLNQTLVEYMKLQPMDANVDSRSLMPLIEDGDKVWSCVPDVSFYRYEKYNGRWFGVRSIRTPEWKYSFNPNGSDELYNIKSDPHEMQNLIDDVEYAETLHDLQIQLLQHLKDCDDRDAYDVMSGFTKLKL